MTALGKGVGPPWSQSSGRAGSPSAAYDRPHFATDAAHPPGRPGGGRGPPGPGSFPGNSGGGRRGRGQGGGSGQSPMHMVRVALRTTTGLQDIMIAGFGIPVGAIFVIGNATADGTATNDSALSIGFTDGTTHKVVSNWAQHASASSNTISRTASDEIFMILDSGSGVVDAEANFDSFINGGVRINVTVVGNPTARLLTVYLIGGPGIKCVVGADSLATATNTVTITPGIKARALFTLKGNGSFDDNTGVPYVLRLGLGALDGSTVTQCCFGYKSADAIAVSTLSGVVRSNKIFCIETALDSAATLGNITKTSFDITSGANDLSGQTMAWLAIDLGNKGKAWAGVQDTPVATGKHEFTGAGFQPAAGIMFPLMHSVINSLDIGDNSGAFGWAGFTVSEEFCNSWADDDGNTTMDTQSLTDDQAINLDADDGTDGFEATFEEFIPDGVQLDFSVVDSTVRKWPTLFMKA